jgi:hypothetical protein
MKNIDFPPVAIKKMNLSMVEEEMVCEECGEGYKMEEQEKSKEIKNEKYQKKISMGGRGGGRRGGDEKGEGKERRKERTLEMRRKNVMNNLKEILRLHDEKVLKV